MPTTIHPFPELRALAEQYAQERADARSRYGHTHDTGGASWAAMGQASRDIAVSVEINLLCDLTRDASRDAVCRLVADKLGVRVSAVHQMIEEAKGPLCDVLPRDVVARIYVTFTEPPTLALIVTHLWPSEP